MVGRVPNNSWDQLGGLEKNAVGKYPNIKLIAAHGGATFARYWVHNGFLTVNGEKMSKSLGNFITVIIIKLNNDRFRLADCRPEFIARARHG